MFVVLLPVANVEVPDVVHDPVGLPSVVWAKFERVILFVLV